MVIPDTEFYGQVVSSDGVISSECGELREEGLWLLLGGKATGPEHHPLSLAPPVPGRTSHTQAVGMLPSDSQLPKSRTPDGACLSVVRTQLGQIIISLV